MGNESSQPTEYGNSIENNISISWKQVELENPFPGRDGHCTCAPIRGGKMYVFGGVVPTENDGHRESNELLVFDAGA